MSLLPGTPALSGNWSVAEVAGLPAPGRWGHTAVALDTQVIIFGGCFGGQHLTNIVAYNRGSGSWSQIRTTGLQPGHRDSHTACLVGRQMVVVGGTDGRSKLDTVDVLSLDTWEWSRPDVKGTPPQPRESHVACATTDGRILVAFGSGDGDSAYLSDGVFVLECASMTWTAPQVAGEAPPARDSAAACMLGRHMVLFGGDQGSKYLADTWILDAETFAWEKVEVPGACPSPRAGLTAVAVTKSLALFFGGVGDSLGSGDCAYYNDVWCFSMETRTWQQLETAGRPPVGRFSHAACMLEDEMYVHGGCAKDELPLEELSVLRLSFSGTPAPLELARSEPGAITAGPESAGNGRSSPGLLHVPSPVHVTPPSSPGLLLSSIPPHPSELLPGPEGPPPAAPPTGSYHSEPERPPVYLPPPHPVQGHADPGRKLERPGSAPTISPLVRGDNPPGARRPGPAVILEGRPISGNTGSPDSSLSLSAGAAAMETGPKRGRTVRTGRSVLSFLESLPPAPDPESPPRRRRVRNRRPSSPSFSGGGASFGPALGRSLSGPVSPGEPDPAHFSSTPQQKQAMQRFLQQRKAEKEQKRQRAAEQGYPAHHDLRGNLAPLHVPPRRMQFGGSAQAGLDYQSGHFTQLLMQDGSPMDVHQEGAGGAMRDPGLTGGMMNLPVHGVIDGIFDMGYRITAQAGGHVFRGCLFSSVPPSTSKDPGLAAPFDYPGRQPPPSMPLPGWPVASPPRPMVGDLENPVAGRRVASMGGHFHPPTQHRSGAYFSARASGASGIQEGQVRVGGEPMSSSTAEAMEGIIQDLQSTHQARASKAQAGARQGGGQLGGQQWPPK